MEILNRVKLIRPHTKKCWYWDNARNPWWFNTYDEMEVRRLSSKGCHRGKDWRWLVINCNSSECDAEAILRADVVAEMTNILLPRI